MGTELDEQAGPALRTWVYHYFLQRPKVVVPMLAAGTPFYNRILLSLAFSRVDEIMRKWMKINQKTADTSQATLEALVKELAEIYQQRRFLVGDQFTRADLTTRSLLAPLFQPPEYPAHGQSRAGFRSLCRPGYPNGRLQSIPSPRCIARTGDAGQAVAE